MAALAVLCTSACAPEDPAPTTTPYLEGAIEAGRWIQSLSDEGSPPPDRLGRPGASAGLASGSAGRAVFFAELFAATGDSSFIRSARAEVEFALTAIDSDPEAAGELYGGMAGIAFAASEVGRITEDETLTDAARALFTRVAAAEVPGGLHIYDVLRGTAGTGLALLYAYRTFGDRSFLDAAIRAGDHLLEQAEEAGDGALRWMRGASLAMDLPNFSHGTAGIAFFLARLGNDSGEERFSEAARAGARYLDAVADTTDGMYLVPYGVPNEGFVTAYDIGWAHGPAGTTRLHYQLLMMDRDSVWLEKLRASAATIAASGAPGPTADSTRWSGPFAIDTRFGTSGALRFLADAAAVDSEGVSLGASGFLADDLLDRATRTQGHAFWSVPLYGFQEGEGEDAFTGLFYGASGMGLALLHHHHAPAGTWPAIRLPDDPFPAS